MVDKCGHRPILVEGRVEARALRDPVQADRLLSSQDTELPLPD